MAAYPPRPTPTHDRPETHRVVDDPTIRPDGAPGVRRRLQAIAGAALIGAVAVVLLLWLL